MPVAVHAAPKTLRFIDRVGYLCSMAGIHALWGVVFLLGRRRTVRLGRLVGRLFYPINKRHRKKMLLNLNLAFGDTLPPEHRERIARRAFELFCANWADVFVTGGRHRGAVLQSISIIGREHLEQALARGRGVIAVSAHMGSYPLLGIHLAKQGYPFIMVVRDLHTPAGSAMYARCRELLHLPSLPTVPERAFFKEALRLLHSNSILCLLADENKRRGGVFVDFFGRSASTAPGPAALARRTGAAIVPMFIIRNPDDTQTIHIDKPIICPRSDDEHSDIQTATDAFTRRIERQIRQDPTQWPWNNWRWRTQPGGQDSAAKISKKTPLKKIRGIVGRARG